MTDPCRCNCNPMCGCVCHKQKTNLERNAGLEEAAKLAEDRNETLDNGYTECGPEIAAGIRALKRS